MRAPGYFWKTGAGFAVWSVACGLTGIAGGLVVLIALRIVLGVGESVLQSVMLKVVTALFDPRDRGLPTGLISSGTRIGLAIGAPLVAWLTLRYDGAACSIWLDSWRYFGWSRGSGPFPPGLLLPLARTAGASSLLTATWSGAAWPASHSDTLARDTNPGRAVVIGRVAAHAGRL